MYKVIKLFTDLHDGNFSYNVGDTFPREGVTVSEDRLTELCGSNNKQKTPLIEKVEIVSKKATKKATKKVTE